MTRNDIQILDTLDTPEYIKGELSDDGWSLNQVCFNMLRPSLELDIPPHMVPPNPDDSDSLSLLFGALFVDVSFLQSYPRRFTHHTLTEIPRTSNTLHQDRGLRTTHHRGLYLRTWDTPAVE
jgi:hypothetical protein